jgi:DNA repair protein RadC
MWGNINYNMHNMHGGKSNDKDKTISTRENEEAIFAYGSESEYRERSQEIDDKLRSEQTSTRGDKGLVHGVRRAAVHLSGIEEGENALAQTRIASFKSINITGLRVRNEKDAANIFSVFRDPRYEVFNRIYTDDDGKILLHEAVSVGIAGMTSAIRTESGVKEIPLIREQLKKTGATKLWISHNHPSGDLTPSTQDIGVTKNYINSFGEQFQGHVILDHTQFSYIDKNLELWKVAFDAPKENFISEKLLSQMSIKPDTIAETFKDVFSDQNKKTTAIAYLDSIHRIVLWEYDHEQKEIQALKDRLLDNAGKAVMVVTNDSKKFDRYYYMRKDNIIDHYKGTENDIILDVVQFRDGKIVRRANIDGRQPQWSEPHAEKHGHIINRETFLDNSIAIEKNRLSISQTMAGNCNEPH